MIRPAAVTPLLAGLLVAGPVPAQVLLDSTASQPTVVIRIVPENLRPVGGAEPAVSERTVGDPFWVTVRTAGPPGHSLLPQSLIDAYRPHPEVAVLDSDRRDGQLRLKMALFRPGAVVLPTVGARVVTGRGDTLTVPVTSDTIRVTSVLAPGDTLLADIKPLWRERGVPAWVWWLAAALALLMVLVVWRWWRKRRRRAPVAAEPRPADAYQAARDAIEQHRIDPPTPARRTAAAAAIADALRGYLADGWGITARERTTLEVLAVLPGRALPQRPALAVLLSTVDLAKFARVAPEPGAVPELARRALTVLDGLDAERRRADLDPASEQAAAS